MNPAQRKIVVVAMTIAVAMLIFPPFSFRISGADLNAGYHFLFVPPHVPGVGVEPNAAVVNVLMLFAQWVCVVIVATGCLAMHRDQRAAPPR